MSATVSGTYVDDLYQQLTRLMPSGGQADIVLGIDRDLSPEQLEELQDYIVDRGGIQLTSPLQIGATDEWPNALRIRCNIPYYSGVGFLPLPVLLFGGLALFGASIIGWKFTSELAKGIQENIVPIVGTLVVGGVIIYYLSRKVPKAA